MAEPNREEGTKTDFQADLVIFWSLVKRQDSHAAVISQGQSHSPPAPPPPPPSLLPSLAWRYCSFVVRAAGGAVRPGSSGAAPRHHHHHHHPTLQGCHLFSPPLSSPLYHSPPNVNAEPLQHPPPAPEPGRFEGGGSAGGLPDTGRKGQGKYQRLTDSALLKQSDGLWLSSVMQNGTTRLHLFSLLDLKYRVQWRDVCHGVNRVKGINWVPSEATQPAAQLWFL